MQPNLLFVLSDQQHYRAVGCVDAHFETPNWDGFAAQATRFETVYCTAPLCSPSRASLLTGLEPPASTVLDNGQPLLLSTLAPALRAAGYQTAWVGKWHLKEQEAATSGWDYARGMYDEYSPPNRPLSDAETLDYAREFLQSARDVEKPFALFVSFDEPHGVYWAMPGPPYPADFMEEPPLRPQTRLPRSWYEHDPATAPVDPANLAKHQAPTRYATAMGEDEAQWRRYREVYRACVQRFDASLGGVLETMRALGLMEDTVVTVTSDHGDMDAHHKQCFKGPVPYEAIQRVPLAIRVPEAFGAEAPAVRADLVSLVDLPATLCEAAGAAFPEARHGQSLWPLLTGRAGAHTREHAFVRYPEPEMWTVRSGEWKYTEHPGLGGFLYDIEKDPEELVNRTDDPDCAAVKARLAALVEAKQGQSLPS